MVSIHVLARAGTCVVRIGILTVLGRLGRLAYIRRSRGRDGHGKYEFLGAAVVE